MKRRRWIGLMLLVGVTAALARIARPRHPQLLESAMRIPGTGGWSRGSASYVWLSNHEAVYFRNAPPGSRHAIRFDITTGKRVAIDPSLIIPSLIIGTAHPGNTFLLNKPPGAQELETTLSPRGDRIAWTFRFWRTPLGTDPTNRLLAFLHLPYHETDSLWISRADGSDMREIGRADPKPGEIVPNVLRWTPDGKRISFLFRDSLWTVSAD